MAKAKPVDEQTVVEHADGSVVVHHHIREWQPHAGETLEQIEAAIDSWGSRAGAPTAAHPRSLDAKYVEAQVDRLTKRVKGSRKEVVTETVTEWVEGPVGSGPINVEEDAPAAALDEAWDGDEAPAGPRGKRPTRRFSWFRSKKDGKAKAAKPAGKEAEPAAIGKEYQPQCPALTDDGAQCRNSSRHGSKYCISHFGYQPPAVKGLAKRIEGDAWDPQDRLTDRQSVANVDTKPAVRKAPDTRLRARKASRKKR